MSARDAISRLNSNRAVGSRLRLPSGHTFVAGRDSFPDRAPLDHVDIAPGEPRLERIGVPPGNHEVIVCDCWPSCGCAGNCDELFQPPFPFLLKLFWIVLALAVAIGLFVTGWRHG